MEGKLTVTEAIFDRIGLDPSSVLSEGYCLREFEFSADMVARRFTLRACLEAPVGSTTEESEFQGSKLIRAFERALQQQGILDERGLDPLLNGSTLSVNGRKLDMPEDW